MADSPGVSEAPTLEITGSRSLPAWLETQGVSLAFTTYQAGKLFFVGSQNNGRLSIFERTFARSMGLWANDQTMWMSSLYQLWRFENALDPGSVHDGYDRLYVPRVGYTTGDVDAHDVVVEDSGRALFVSTMLNCIATLSETRSLKPVWKPPFISKIIPEDRCHLNGLATRDGEARYATSVSRTDVIDGWREHRRDGGCVIDITTNEIVATGLSMPHSPRWHGGKLWLLNAGTGEFGFIDPDSGKFEPVAFCPGFLRGLAFHGDYAVVGMSGPRHDGTFSGLELEERLAKLEVSGRCGLQVIDLKTGAVAHWLNIEGVVTELYDVAVLSGTRRPMALGFKTKEIEHLLALE